MHKARELLRTRCVMALIAVGCLGLGASAKAGTVLIAGGSGPSAEGLGRYEGAVSYSFDSAFDVGRLVIDLTNTSPTTNGGYITGLAFNIVSADGSATADLTSATHSFSGIKNVNANPFGTFDEGAALQGNFQGGGPPTPGIVIGETGTFTFDIEASDAAFLTAMDFVAGDSPYNFVVRFRGFDDGGSDKVVATIIPLPASAALGLAGLGVIGVGGALRRRRSAG